MTQNDLTSRLLKGHRRALAKAITLVESTRPADRDAAEHLVESALPASGNSVRIGITGAPGAGKSTLIEALGQRRIEAGGKVAVLAIDPVSLVGGGAILGDKTRMSRLAGHPGAFIRPSPSGPNGGGVGRRTREAILLCEAAGFDTIIVETVGVGQSEAAVAAMVDQFLLLLAPGGGDSLQAMKRGVLELADVIAVNKADGALLSSAQHMLADFRQALAMKGGEGGDPSGGDSPAGVPLVACSALTGDGLDMLEKALSADLEAKKDSGRFGRVRAQQRDAWLWAEMRQQLLDRLQSTPGMADLVERARQEARYGAALPPALARTLIARFVELATGGDVDGNRRV